MGNKSSRPQASAASAPMAPSPSGVRPTAPSPSDALAQGQVQKAFANDHGDWDSVFESLSSHHYVQEKYGQMLEDLTDAERKVLQARTLVPLQAAAFAKKPASLLAKRSGVLNGYRDFAEKQNIPWRTDAAQLEQRGVAVWEAERAAKKRKLVMPPYYEACYNGPIHSYNSGNGEWMAAFDAPSAYLLVHLHHYPELSAQAAFDALHEELDRQALEVLAETSPARFVRVLDIGCGVGTSTFSTARSLEQLGRIGSITGVDLSDYFITVAEHLKQVRAGEFNGTVSIDFMHGDGLDLAPCGFADGTLEMVTVSEVTHEMPKKVSEQLFREVARVLAPGGVLAYLDINQAQVLKDSSPGAIAERIATSNEPYFDQFLELDTAAAMRAAGLEVVKDTWPNHKKYATLESSSLRIMVARKNAALSLDTWTGRWALDRRENWLPWLQCLGVPESAHEVATKAPDFHQYRVTEDGFYMDHQIPGQTLHLRFSSFIDGTWHESPYKKPTTTQFDEEQKAKIAENVTEWKHEWVAFPTCFESTTKEFPFPGKTFVLRRELIGLDTMKYSVKVTSEDGSLAVENSTAYYKKTSTEPPVSVAVELKERFATGISRSLEWRQEALSKILALAEENMDAISAAQAEDHVSPSAFMGAIMMMKSAVAFYKANLSSWAAAQSKDETLPPFLRTEGDWEVVPEPKGVGLVIAPWNAPVLLCLLPLMGMVAAGNLCVLKPSETAKATSRLIAKLITKYFPGREVLVAEGGPEVVVELINTPVDHILFTGGGSIAKKILALAAKHITPVSLELGGKNPCFVDASDAENLALYVAEIVGTKSYFGGQFCQAHDYCLVHEKVFDQFLELLEEKINALGPRRSCQMINAGHAQRIKAMLAGHEKIARPPLPEGEAEDKVPVTVLVCPDLNSELMKEEVFGPLLPIVKVASAAEAIEFVKGRPKPLVAYCYSQDEAAWAAFRDATSSGNLSINAGPQRMQSNLNVGFGGVGDSGFGYSIWGRAAFDDYSHHKAVFTGKKFAGSAWGAAPPPGKGGGKGKETEDAAKK
mmetsp:Transcript_121362/g.387973  ORF Transcript_121362/g.387973 Transcript_121362/m.387973 type:complete len:1046 (+) Transcript_121362:58-3195(+)